MAYDFKEKAKEVFADKPKTAEELYKERQSVTTAQRLAGQIVVPDIYYWVEYDLHEKPILMTAAFVYFSKKFGSMRFGLSYKIEAEWGPMTRNSYKKKLLGHVMETLDIVVHHGDRVLDNDGNIIPARVNDAEAERFYLDKEWKAKIDAFHKVVKIKQVNHAMAKQLKLA